MIGRIYCWRSSVTLAKKVAILIRWNESSEDGWKTATLYLLCSGKCLDIHALDLVNWWEKI